MSKKLALNRLKWGLVLLFGAIEFVALFLIAVFDIDNKTNTNILYNFIFGFFVGFITLFFILFIINFVLSRVKVKFLNQRLRKIYWFYPSLYNGFFLAILFAFESFISPLKEINIFLGNSIVALITMSVILPFLIISYNFLSVRGLCFSFLLDKKERVVHIGLFGVTLCGVIYEIFALPIMGYFSKMEFLYTILGETIGFSLIGFIAGVIGSSITIFIYNRFLRNKLSVDFSS